MLFSFPSKSCLINLLKQYRSMLLFCLLPGLTERNAQPALWELTSKGRFYILFY